MVRYTTTSVSEAHSVPLRLCETKTPLGSVTINA